MDQTNPPLGVPSPITEITELTTLKKHLRTAGWVAVCIGYLYLLSCVFSTLSLVLSLAAKIQFDSLLSGGTIQGVVLFAVLLAAPRILSALILGLALIALGKRITAIRKGFIWRAGEAIADANSKEYLWYLTLFFGVELIVEAVILSASVSIPTMVIGLAIELILFLVVFRGYVAAKKAVLIPAFTQGAPVPAYRKSSHFWARMMVIGILLIFLPYAIKLVFQDQIKSINDQLREQSIKLLQLTPKTP